MPIALRVDVRLGKRVVDYRGAVQMQSRFRLRLDRPCTVSVDIEEVQAHHIRTAVNPVGSRGFTASGCEATSTSSKSTLLRELRFAPTDAPGERRRWRGVATVPARGARA